MRTETEERLFGAVGTEDCHQVGIMGGCGKTCWVYLEGRCEYADRITEELATKKEIEKHAYLYKTDLPVQG